MKGASVDKKKAHAMTGNLMASRCPSRIVLRHLTSRWGGLLILALQSQHPQRFGDLRRRVEDISERMLAQTLRWLEADGMIDRRDFQTVPPHVEYTLTPLGREAAEKMRVLADWIESNLPQIVENWDKTGITDR